MTNLIEKTGTGSIERTGTGSIERTGTGKITRALILTAVFGCACAGVAVADTASYATSHGTIDIHSNGSEVRVSWHYDDGENRRFLVGTGPLMADYSAIKLTPIHRKIIRDGTGSDLGRSPDMDAAGNWRKIIRDGTGSDLGRSPDMDAAGNWRKIIRDGTGSDLGRSPDMDAAGNWRKIIRDGTGEIDLELIFTAKGVEAVATMRNNVSAEIESIVLDLNHSAKFSRAVVFVDSALF